MKVIQDNLKNIMLNEPTCITIGNLDGIHLGHKALLNEVISLARRRGLKSCIITFTPHPALFFHKNISRFLLTTDEEKMAIMEDFDIDYLILMSFDKELSNISARDFLKEIRKRFKPRVWVIGPDHRFGKDQEGDPHILWNFTSENNIILTIFPCVLYQNRKVSSSRIREFLRNGEVTFANHLLSHPYIICSKVESGTGRGKGMGIPTANLEISEEKCLPKTGVYYGDVTIGNDRRKVFSGVLNIGTRPTFKEDIFQVEVHIIDFKEDIYGEYITLRVKDFIREEKKFESPENLINQIQSDISIVRKNQPKGR